MIATEAFIKLLNVMLRSRQAPASIAIVIKGNPEYTDPAAIPALADNLLDETVRRLAGADGSGALIG